MPRLCQDKNNLYKTKELIKDLYQIVVMEYARIKPNKSPPLWLLAK